ncbi:hypothetical protein OCU04_010909 [Sclerotinia nivalis]|uniref:Uncharacterized protein n=1 Tax=Sclerotinia nivalis TaxID=352851 RepID=A0A9X0AGP3_9HELO|nr:hypothetical protein OCU04_010909 [Sclerotinia nivalis]
MATTELPSKLNSCRHVILHHHFQPSSDFFTDFNQAHLFRPRKCLIYSPLSGCPFCAFKESILLLKSFWMCSGGLSPRCITSGGDAENPVHRVLQPRIVRSLMDETRKVYGNSVQKSMN